MYAIVDIETTGLRVTEDRITEVAVVVFDGQTVVQSFHSLINPERYLPEYISQLTGITNEMLATAPRFFEIAKELVQITEGKVLVAHNAHFDYTFLRNEFKNLGFTFQRKTLCTVRLSRKLFPNLPSYSLGKLCHHFQIAHQNQHRAQGDAQATVALFDLLLRQNEGKARQEVIDPEIKIKTLPPKISYTLFESLPEATGVYYFHDEEGRVIYVGKSKNIKKRIAAHFSTNLDNRKTLEIKNRVADLSYQITGSELIALLLESDEIKKYQPLFNRAQRRSRFQYGVFSRKDRQGYRHFYVEKIGQQTKPVLLAAVNAQSAREALRRRVEAFGLCMKLCHLYEAGGACFAYHVKQCQGACIGAEPSEAYNLRAQAALESFDPYVGKTFFVLTKGRYTGEKALVLVEKGRYLGWGYLDETASFHSPEEAKTYIKTYPDNKDIQKIIWAWAKKYPQHVHFWKNLAH
ncbi:MAG: exonuclease domain-containing protein [Microscillaceae bacterium]